ncbi:PREDICTED: uncharacterized protein LOC104702665 [Camelina sativa]|uniref:Uncharacterized protein LOC104702665 n=1 Tax=Camelina sativa TaxID=90675 RepID=A0ABM1QDW8_CAMSA|nr:PREDICTED: uncharacterized protein LOC104702665 [Camelina sativa]
MGCVKPLFTPYLQKTSIRDVLEHDFVLSLMREVSGTDQEGLLRNLMSLLQLWFGTCQVKVTKEELRCPSQIPVLVLVFPLSIQEGWVQKLHLQGKHKKKTSFKQKWENFMGALKSPDAS